MKKFIEFKSVERSESGNILEGARFSVILGAIYLLKEATKGSSIIKLDDGAVIEVEGHYDEVKAKLAAAGLVLPDEDNALFVDEEDLEDVPGQERNGIRF